MLFDRVVSVFCLLCALGVTIAGNVSSSTRANNGQTVVVPITASPRTDNLFGTDFNVTINGKQQLLAVSLSGPSNTIGYEHDLGVNYNSTDCIVAQDDELLQCPFNASIHIGNVTLDGYAVQVVVNRTNPEKSMTGSLSFANGGGSITAMNNPANLIGEPSFPQALFNAGKIPQPAAALYYNGNHRDGYLVLGDPEAANFSDIDLSSKTVLPHRSDILVFNETYFLLNDRFFGVPLDGIQIGNETIITEQSDLPANLASQLLPQRLGVDLDATYDLIILGRNDSTTLVSRLFGDAAIPADGSLLEASVGGWIVPCDYQTPNASIILGGRSFPMSAENWITAPNPAHVVNGTCFSTVAYSSTVPVHVLGLPFLSTVYSAFYMDSQAVVLYQKTK